MRPIFVTGTGTEVGKTVVSAILVEALHADYWKPIQAGDLEETDTDRVRRLVSNELTSYHPEAVRLRTPASPHAAAKAEGRRIDLDELALPSVARARPLVVEGAGGLLVPLNEREVMVDLIEKLDAETVVVSKNYLGSINHTLLTLEALAHRRVPMLGLVFNGEENVESESVILAKTGVPLLGRLRWEATLTPAIIRHHAEQFASVLARHGRSRVVGT